MVKILMAGRNLQAHVIFIALITSPSQTQTFRGTEETLNMHHATQLHCLQAQKQVEEGHEVQAVLNSSFLDTVQEKPQKLCISVPVTTEPQHRASVPSARLFH